MRDIKLAYLFKKSDPCDKKCQLYSLEVII